MSATPRRPIGRPRRHAEYDAFEANLPDVMSKRPAYLHGIGLFRGARDYTAWVKIRCPHGAIVGGKHVAPGDAHEFKLGKRASFDWPDLIAERDRLQELADKGLPLENHAVPTFASHAADWLTRKRVTIKGYGVSKGHVSTALNPTFGKSPLDGITVADVNRWIARQSEKLKPATVQRQLSTFNSIMNDAVRSGIIERNPAQRADKIKGIEPRQRFVTEAEWQMIVKTAERIEAEQEAKKEQTPQQIRGWLRHYVVWAYESGMRRAEILALTWANVRSVEGWGTQIEIINTKTSNPRHITCTTEMEGILAALAKLDRIDGDDRLFPVSMVTLKRSLRQLWQKTGLPDVRLHDLRRTHATMLMRLGVDIKSIAGRTGHSDIKTLSKIYAVYSGDAEAVKRFEARGVVADDERALPAPR